MLRKPMVGLLIAIDGPAGSGKSSVARAVAGELGFVDLNTGAVYRAVALLALQEGLDLDDDPALAEIARRVDLDAAGALVDGEPVPEKVLRTPEVSGAASKVSAWPGVRQVLLSVQRDAAHKAREEGGAVVEGRDIGTVVFPDAELKVYLTAGDSVRARRRSAETGGAESSVASDMATRDRSDSTRAASPLKAADDAVVLDTSELSVDQVVDEVLRRL